MAAGGTHGVDSDAATHVAVDSGGATVVATTHCMLYGAVAYPG